MPCLALPPPPLPLYVLVCPSAIQSPSLSHFPKGIRKESSSIFIVFTSSTFDSRVNFAPRGRLFVDSQPSRCLCFSELRNDILNLWSIIFASWTTAQGRRADRGGISLSTQLGFKTKFRSYCWLPVFGSPAYVWFHAERATTPGRMVKSTEDKVLYWLTFTFRVGFLIDTA